MYTTLLELRLYDLRRSCLFWFQVRAYFEAGHVLKKPSIPIEKKRGTGWFLRSLLSGTVHCIWRSRDHLRWCRIPERSIEGCGGFKN